MFGIRSLRPIGAAVVIGLLGLAVLPQLALGAGFAAKASLSPGFQYVGDSAGTTYTLTVKNTGGVRGIGAVQITAPSTFWTVIACPSAPTGWTNVVTASRCLYESQTGGADDIRPGASRTFTLNVATAPANANRSGSWTVAVSAKKDFTDPSWVKQAGGMARGLKTKAYSFELTDAVVASEAATVGDPCPASNDQAHAGSGQVLVLCGINHTNMSQTPKEAYSTLTGTFAASHGSFSSGPVAPGTASVVLGNWGDVDVAGSPATGLTLGAVVGAYPKRTSPPLNLADFEATNTAPAAADDDCTTDEDSTCVGNVLANDSDADGDFFTVSEASSNGTSWISPGGSGDIVVASAHGVVTIKTTGVNAGSYTDTPNTDYNGSDSFEYKITDGFAESAAATVSITVDPVNDPSVANTDDYSTNEDTPLNVAAPGVLGNDSDIDGDSLHISALNTDAAHGALTLNPDGSFSYSPDGNYNGSDSFIYTANDGTADSNQATVTITVNPVNDAPVAVDDSFSMDENTTQSYTAVNGLLTDATDVDADSLTAVEVTGPSHSTSFTFNADGSFSYQPVENYTGGDSFTWKANDGNADSNTGTVTITVNSTGGGGGGGGGGCSAPDGTPSLIAC